MKKILMPAKIIIKKEVRDAIVAQAIEEIQHARLHKQGKISNWQKNEAMYYGKKLSAVESRANIELGRMPEFVHGILAKIDTPMRIRYGKTKEAQIKRVAALNALVERDRKEDSWDIKDLVGKKQAIIYGRAVYSYYATSEKGYYCPNHQNVEVYNFLIDPAAGGLFIDQADYLGDYGVRLNRTDLEKGMKTGTYLRDETARLLAGNGTAADATVENTNSESRTRSTGLINSKRFFDGKDRFTFWRWYTTYKGKRYYLLLSEKDKTAIRVERLKEMYSVDKKLGDAPWPYWSWAAFADMTEFWTPSFCDYVREVFMAQSVSVNQGFDNTEEINKPTRAVVMAAIANLNSLKYRRGGAGVVEIKPGYNVNQVVQKLDVPSIDTPIKMYQLLETIQEKASGLTAGAKGVSDEDKVGIYEGNQANAADRFGLLNKTYAFGYERFGKLHELGVKDHLNRKVALDILGPDGYEAVTYSKRDIYTSRNEYYLIIVESSDAESASSMADKRARLSFLSANAMNPVQNPKKAYEMAGRTVGFSDEELRQLMDTSEFGNADLMSEAERDIERILDGERIQPNRAATTAYKQRFVDYMANNEENLDAEQFKALADYVLLLDPVIMENMRRKLVDEQLKMAAGAPVGALGAPQGGGAAQMPSAMPDVAPGATQGAEGLLP